MKSRYTEAGREFQSLPEKDSDTLRHSLYGGSQCVSLSLPSRPHLSSPHHYQPSPRPIPVTLTLPTPARHAQLSCLYS
ncbi:hypothetical protein E2C01_026919 [Portunus trituberculatus]|uniref:Uncharacterized protein n=1 Tax=Portunus trituberculatus TaxID=210409 RepID=A0A5B7EMD0_PORTR|nr:hypothetical protein [Portunus trituberculatus]